jgi:hypothetical protein
MVKIALRLLLMAMVLVLGRLCDPSSELRWADRFYEHSALPDLLGLLSDQHQLALLQHLGLRLPSVPEFATV